MRIKFNLEITGPVSEHMAGVVFDRAARHIENVVGDRAVNDIQAYLPTQYMYLGNNGGDPINNPVPPDAGRLVAQIHTERQVPNAVVVTDTPVVYGPWIEGVSHRNDIVWPHKRNPPPRRFPGYHTFRKIAQQLDNEAGSIAQSEIEVYVKEMNA